MERCHRILLTTSLRSGRRVDGRGEEVGGSLLLGTLDLEEGCFRCERQADLPESPHIRGRRSARGVFPFAGGVAVCNATEVFLLDPDPLPGRIHDGVILESGHYLAWTQAGRLVMLCPATGEPVASVDCSVPLGTTTGSPIAARHGWLRGVLHLGGELFLVGQSRLTLFLVDMAAGTRRGPLPVHGADGDRSAPGLAIYCMAKA
jgi:hypothetical protein